MSVDERSRHQLYRRLQEVLGAEEATTLMEHLPRGGTGWLATKDDLKVLEQALELKMDSMRHELRAEIHRSARTLTLSLATIVTVLNGIVFAALRLG